MKFINTNPKGDRILHVMPDENNHPQFGAWYYIADNFNLLFGLLEAEDIDIENLDKGDKHYLVLQRRGNRDTGIIVIKYTRAGDGEDQDYIFHDIVFGEDFIVACDIIEKYYKTAE